MAHEQIMPQLSDTMEAGTIVKWFVDEGDEVEMGDVIAEVETDKATMEVEAFESGVLLKKVAREGDEIPTQSIMAVIGEKGEDISDLDLESEEKSSGEDEVEESEEEEPAPDSEPETEPKAETD
ncbi:MAG: biotin/lipoyl-containing protein, partial [bacterium]